MIAGIRVGAGVREFLAVSVCAEYLSLRANCYSLFSGVKIGKGFFTAANEISLLKFETFTLSTLPFVCTCARTTQYAFVDVSSRENIPFKKIETVKLRRSNPIIAMYLSDSPPQAADR